MVPKSHISRNVMRFKMVIFLAFYDKLIPWEGYKVTTCDIEMLNKQLLSSIKKNCRINH